MSDTADVIQGRLGWESGDVSEAKVANLEPHPKNSELYGDTKDLPETFVESIREKGVLEPLVITTDKQVISGHRRLSAAKMVGVESVPVRISDFDTDLAEREALIEFNRQREKTPGQIVNEFEEILKIEKERAKERQGQRTDLKKHSGNVSKKSDEQPARGKAAEKIDADVSGRTLEKGLEVKEKAESGNETAQEAWDGLQSGEESFSGAHQKVKNAEEDKQHTVVDAATKQETDEWSSPRELVEPLRDVINGFALDPCSGAEQSPFAESTFTKDDDGLAQPWEGDVWVNPPYSNVSEWTEKAIQEVESGNVDCIFYLCKGDSSTDWWQRGAAAASVVVTIDHRLKFGDSNNSAPFPSHILIFGDVPPEAFDVCADYGVVLSEVGGGLNE